MFNELDCVRATKDLSPLIPKGTIGVVHENSIPGLYLVEFLEDGGPGWIDILSVKEANLELFDRPIPSDK